MAHKTDTDWLMGVLVDGREHELGDVIRRSFQERGCGLTVHSRVADLRKRGLTITNRRDKTNGRVRSFYRWHRPYDAPLSEAQMNPRSAPPFWASLSGDGGAGRTLERVSLLSALPSSLNSQEVSSHDHA